MQCLRHKGHIFNRFYIHSYILHFLLLELILIFSHIWDLRELRSGLNDAVIIQPAETLTSPINEKEELKGKRQALLDKAANNCITVFQYLSLVL